MTQKLKRILVATDMSARSDRAMERAFVLAKPLSIPVHVLMVLDDAMPETMLSGLHDKAVSQLEAMCERWSNGVDYTVNVQVGDPTEEILKAADPNPETLLVMGPHRPRPFLDGLRETTMQRVVRRMASPVLLATGPVTSGYSTQLSLVDFSPASTAAMILGATLAPNAEITAAHAIHVPYSGMLETTGSVQMDLQAAFLKDAETSDKNWRASDNLPAKLTDTTKMVQAPPMGLVHELTKGGEFDLLTAGAHGRVGAARYFLGSMALDLMRDPPCDVLIARD